MNTTPLQNNEKLIGEKQCLERKFQIGKKSSKEYMSENFWKGLQEAGASLLWFDVQ